MKFVINEELGEKIKTLYLIDGLSCTKIGKEVGISTSTISSFLKRNGIKTTNIVYIILEVLLLLFRKLPLLTLNSFIYDSPSL